MPFDSRMVRRHGMFALLLSAALVGHRAQAQTPPVLPTQVRPFEPDSFSYRDEKRRDAVLSHLAAEAERLATARFSIPEYHDEQRLPSWPAGAPPRNRVNGLGIRMPPLGTFGPVVNIFASPYLDDFRYRWQFIEHGKPGVLVALVWVDTAAGSTLPKPYLDLHLRPGLNCLWLGLSAAGQWTGTIAPASPAQTCDSTKVDPATYATLRVVPTPEPLFPAPGNYPPVARFSETADGRPLLGTKCLAGWCEFGPNDGWTTGPYPPGTVREARIRGWHDAQWLTRLEGGVLRPDLYAAVIPVPDIASHPQTYYTTARLVARVILAADPHPNSKYHRWGLRRGTNPVYLGRVGNEWLVHFGPAGVGRWLRAKRMPHRDAGVPPTARWRYSSGDDTIWVPCGQACCRAEEAALM